MKRGRREEEGKKWGEERIKEPGIRRQFEEPKHTVSRNQTTPQVERINENLTGPWKLFLLKTTHLGPQFNRNKMKT